jgi:hypothetical protein
MSPPHDPPHAGAGGTAPSAPRPLGDLVNGYWTTQAIAAAVELGVFDRLAQGSCDAPALAQAAGCHAPSLARLLDALASLGLVVAHDDGRYALSELGAQLRSDADGSLAWWSRFCGGRLWARFASLAESVRTGASARLRAGDTDDFADYERDRAAGDAFQRAMADVTRPVAEALVRAVDLAGVDRIVDVGGGFGRMLATILAAHPDARGVLFDLAHVIAAARGELERAGVASRCDFVAGSFFNAIPGGADAYVIKSVLHDWDDERCATILRNCAAAMRGRPSRLLVVERLRPERYGVSPRDQAIARSDLIMLVSLGGRERTEREYRAMLVATGFRVERVDALPGEFAVIEARPAA